MVASSASGGIFLSYRRQESSDVAGRLYDRLVDRFGEGQVFIDVDTPTPGADFGQAIANTVAACKVLLAVIGPDWLTVADGRGQRRLDNPDDSVRLEIETALARGVRVIPILVECALMPSRHDLPESLAGLARRNALLIRNESFRYDAGRLVAALERVLEAPGTVAVPIVPDTREQGARTEEDTDEQVEKIYSAAMSPGGVQAEQEKQVQSPQHRQPKIFLCYRREDTQGFARGIYESLAGKYGREQVFRDIDSTPAGVRFSSWIESRVGQCSVMVVLIGAAWLSVKDRTGQRRLDLPKDWVRQEIEAALRREIPIIPVCVQGVPMPSEDELPPSIADLTGFQSAEVTDSRWDFDMTVLTRDIDSLIASD